MKRLLIISLFFYFSSFAFSQFQAKMTNSFSGTERLYTVYSDLNQYRYEFDEDGMKGVVIVNPGANQTAILIPEKKFVHQTSCDGMMSRMNDPVQAYEAYKKYGTEKTTGKETLDSYECTIKDIYQGETKVFTAWYAEKLNFPVKIVGHFAKNTYMELKEIKKWKVESSYFEIPEDYTEVDEQMRPIISEPPPPDSWETREVSIPYEGKVKRGNKIKITIPESVYYKFITTNAGDTPTKFTYHLYENGEKLTWEIVGNDRLRTNRLYMEEKKTQTMDWKEGWVLIIEVFEGELELKIYPEK